MVVVVVRGAGQSCQARVVSAVMSCQGYKEGCSLLPTSPAHHPHPALPYPTLPTAPSPLAYLFAPNRNCRRQSSSGSSICGELALGILVSQMQFKKHVNGVALPRLQAGGLPRLDLLDVSLVNERRQLSALRRRTGLED